MPQLSREHLVSQMIESSAARPPPQANPMAAVMPPGDPTGALVLPAPRQLERSLQDVIRSRRSGGIQRSTVAAAELSTLLVAAAKPLPDGLRRARVPLPLMLPLVWDVPDVDPGAYRFEPRGNLLLPLNRGADRAAGEALLLQAEHRAAAVVIFLVAPMALWIHESGDRGYRGAALQIGYISDRLYLVAEALGLIYTASGGFSPPMVDRFLGLDSYSLTTFFSFVVGGRRR